MHLLAVVAIVHLAINFSWWTVLLGVAWYALCGLSITAGYHRLFSHRSYGAHPLIKAFFLTFGAATFQRSAMKWCHDHRIHHRYGDEAEDPYSVRHGFWWAHCGWIISQGTTEKIPVPQDLESDALVRFQHRYWVAMAVIVSAFIPAALGLLWGDPWGAILVAGPLRIVLTWHSTFAVNSFAHRFGRQAYSTATSARDSFWVALITLGEGYHNFHHRFQSDYRNGVRWYQYDPTKWLVWSLERLGLVRGVKRVPGHAIVQARSLTQRGRAGAPQLEKRGATRAARRDRRTSRADLQETNEG